MSPDAQPSVSTQPTELRSGGIAILDFGSQYTQLIARRVREQGVYAEVFACDASADHVNTHQPQGYILSGGPNSIYEDGSPQLPDYILASGLPVFGICYGMQALTYALGGVVAHAPHREYGFAQIEHRSTDNPLFNGIPDQIDVWMSHGDRIERPPQGFEALAHSDNSPYAAMGDTSRGLYAVQFHPEVNHTPQGAQILRNFIFDICGCEAKWTPAAFIEDALARIRARVGGERVLLALSGGVDSAVAGALLHRAIGEQLVSVFVNTGLLRQDEPEQVVQVFRDQEGMNLIAVDTTEDFLDALHNVTEPEAKRKIIGKLFIDTFSAQARQLEAEGVRFLAQGTIYPDVIESAASSNKSRVIKSHHNVGGLAARPALRADRAAARPVQGRGAGGRHRTRLARQHRLAAALPRSRLSGALLRRDHVGAAGDAARRRRHLPRGTRPRRDAAATARRKPSRCCCRSRASA